jgi:hypothetical protein
MPGAAIGSRFPHDARERGVEGKSIFISSCSRRQLARRRPQSRPSAMRTQLMMVAVVAGLAIATLIAGRGGL